MGTTTIQIDKSIVNSLKEKNVSYGGVICPGNDAVDLMTNEKRLFLERLSSRKGKTNLEKMRKHFDKEGIKPSEHCDKFINKEGMAFAVKAVKNAIDKCDFIFIDEYGPLELKGRGLAGAINDAFNSHKNILIIVRDKLKDYFLKKYSDFNFEIFDINKEEDMAKAKGLVETFIFDS